MLKIDRIIAKSLLNEASLSEMTELESWLNSSEENRTVYEKLVQTWKEKTYRRRSENADEILEKVWRSGSKPRIIRTVGNYYLRIAAIVMALIISSFLIYLNFYGENHATVLADKAATQTIKENPKGQKSKIFLPDGSTVWLNSESSLKYNEDFSDSVRLVELSGEGYFEVARDLLKPFIVKSGNILTTALGTSFNVNAFPGSDAAIVTLVSGKVKINVSAGAGIDQYLLPSMSIRYDYKDQSFFNMTIDPGEAVAWKDGLLVFNNSSYQEVVTALERWYGVQIQTEGPIPGNWQLTARFENESLEETLEAIMFSRDFRYALDNKHLTIIF